MDVVEHTSTVKLPLLLDKIKAAPDESWGIAWINRKQLKPMTNEALVMCIRPALDDALSGHVFYDGEAQFYVAWSGDTKKVYKKLHGHISSALTNNTGTSKTPLIGFINPGQNSTKLMDLLQIDTGKNSPSINLKIEELFSTDDDYKIGISDEDLKTNESTLTSTPEQNIHYHKIRNEKAYRKQLQILIAEDSVFSQKLLSDIIRGARNQSGEAPVADIVPTAKEAWAIFLKKVPDISFIDLRLADGSGHTLVGAMKEVDSSAYVVVVTANDFEEEVAVARQNNVDGFIVKPYTKKQILDTIDKYRSMTKTAPKFKSR